jgi:hypothetical protein
MDGWICMHRVLLEKPIWKLSTPAHKTVLVTMLLMANHEPQEWEWMGKTFTVQPGEFVTSLASIKKKCGKGVGVEQIRRAIARFKKLHFCTEKATKMGRIITILNWDKYQSQLKQCRQRGRQSTDKPPTPNNNDNNVTNKTLYDFYVEKIAPSKKSRQRALKNIETYLKREPYEKLEAAILNYESTIGRTDPKFRKDPANFFGINEPYACDFYPESFRKPEKQEPKTPEWF